MLSENVMQSLPLVAAVLGNRYGVEVSIGGNEASTNGREIRLPSLPVNCDATVMGLVRGYIDHESAHVRETDFEAIKGAQLTPLERHIMNSIEDWRVENKLTAVFPGCRGNVKWLIRYFFGSDYKNKGGTITTLLPDWVLLTVRGWDESSAALARDQVEALIDVRFPGLLGKLKTVMQEVRDHCSSTAESISYAKKIVAIVTKQKTATCAISPQYLQGENGRQQVAQVDLDGVVKPGEKQPDSIGELTGLLGASQEELPKTFGDILSEKLTSSIRLNPKRDKLIKVAKVGTKTFTAFPLEDQPEIRKAESALRIRIQCLLQARAIKNERIGRQGRLEPRRLSRMKCGDLKIFRSGVKKEGMNTAVHLLLDCSGSMRKKMQLTTKVCGALVKALDSVEGINVGVTAFPARTDDQSGEWNGVYPVVVHGANAHSEFSTSARGGTPMGEAIWWVLQKMVLITEDRKIVLIITDGYPDSKENVRAALKAGKELGCEIYGLGVEFSGITDLFQADSCYVEDISELPPAIFQLLKNKL